MYYYYYYIYIILYYFTLLYYSFNYSNYYSDTCVGVGAGEKKD